LLLPISAPITSIRVSKDDETTTVNFSLRLMWIGSLGAAERRTDPFRPFSIYYALSRGQGYKRINVGGRSRDAA
jgi:hypothetical protein